MPPHERRRRVAAATLGTLTLFSPPWAYAQDPPTEPPSSPARCAAIPVTRVATHTTCDAPAPCAPLRQSA